MITAIDSAWRQFFGVRRMKQKQERQERQEIEIAEQERRSVS